MADDEMITDRIGHVPHVQVYDVLAFHLLNAFNDRIHQAGGGVALRSLHPVYLGSVQRYKVTKLASGLNSALFHPSTSIIGRQFIELGSAESTNKTAAEMLSAGELVHGAVILAHEQTAGTGQRGRSWYSAAGLDLTFSVVIFPRHLKADEQFILGKVTALALLDVVSVWVKQEVRIKWPNDVLVERRKIAGVLIQNDLLGENVASSIIGIGLNVNNTHFDEGLLATSMALETGANVDRWVILEQLCERLEARILQWEKGDDLSGAYASALWARGRWTEMMIDGATMMARPMDVDGAGRLILEMEDGRVEALGLDRSRFAGR